MKRSLPTPRASSVVPPTTLAKMPGSTPKRPPRVQPYFVRNSPYYCTNLLQDEQNPVLLSTGVFRLWVVARNSDSHATGETFLEDILEKK